MSITNTEVLNAVNVNLNRSETDIDEQTRMALKKLSGHGNYLHNTDTASLSDGTTYIAEPTDFKDIEAIVLNDGTDDGAPLEKIEFDEYLKRKEDESSDNRDEPKYYARFNKRFYVDPTADGSYTATIYFYRYHTDSLNTILFGDEWREAIYSLATFYVAKKFGIERYMKLYGGNEEGALALAISQVQHNQAKQPIQVKYHDV